MGWSEGLGRCAGQVGYGLVSSSHQPQCGPLAGDTHAGPSGDNQGQTLQEYILVPPCPGGVGLAPQGIGAPCIPLSPCAEYFFCRGGRSGKEERGREVSAVPSLGVVVVRRQGSVSLCTQAAGCVTQSGEPAVGPGPKSTRSSQPCCPATGRGMSAPASLNFEGQGVFLPPLPIPCRGVKAGLRVSEHPGVPAQWLCIPGGGWEG